MRLDGEWTVHSHLRMDGSWYVSQAGVRPRRHPEHFIRVRLGNAEWTATGYRVHDLRVVPRSGEAELVGHLGPDVLGPDWDRARAVANLLAEPDVPVGEALLDQRKLAGIGNLYKCEILFVERINPWTRVADITDLDGVVGTAYRLMRANRDHPEQSTTGYVARGREHWVYRRAGEACLRCRTPIRRADQGSPPHGRITYWCAQCQQLPGAVRAAGDPLNGRSGAPRR
jgi:endonuclease-8